MSSAAQYSEQYGELPEQTAMLPAGSESSSPLKQAVAERLAAHRHRRASERAHEEASVACLRARAEQERSQSRRGAVLVREAVQARYQQSQSYREFLAAEAERALAQAQAEAEVAARNAAAVAEAQVQLLADIEAWSRPEEAVGKAEVRSELAHELADIALGARELMAEPPMLTVLESPKDEFVARRGLTVRLYEALGSPSTLAAPPQRPATQDSPGNKELAELEAEIAFRRSPEFPTQAIETEAIPANIIEFPRQLIAPRKARPRLAEGPLVQESAPEPQLRIFEVEPAQIASGPEPGVAPAGAPEWQSLLLDSAAAVHETLPDGAQASFTFQPQAAETHRRVLAAAVDAACVFTAFAAFSAVALWIDGATLHALKLPLLGASAAASLGFFFLAFQMLFFTFSDATPGMRCARIALCTFGDDHPTRKAMRRRTLAIVLATCPLGIGLAWMWMDGDRLGWHDRISRMYQRAY